jgi:flagellar basal-body rod modification protein FlgD
VAVDGINANTPTSGTEAPRRDTQLGRDAFLQLLTTQLAHQDPTAPQADGEFIAQLAQFSSLEQLTQMSKTLEAIGTALGVDVSQISAK